MMPARGIKILTVIFYYYSSFTDFLWRKIRFRAQLQGHRNIILKNELKSWRIRRIKILYLQHFYKLLFLYISTILQCNLLSTKMIKWTTLNHNLVYLQCALSSYKGSAVLFSYSFLILKILPQPSDHPFYVHCHYRPFFFPLKSWA